MNLFYTKWYFCEEPPESGAASGCVIGAEPEVAPRPGPIPTIYAIAAVGFQPDPSTLACAGEQCVPEPSGDDRCVAGRRCAGHEHSGPAAQPHPRGAPSGLVQDGQYPRVQARRLDRIAAAKSLAKVRELQADPAVGGAGLISPDTPTNIFFFIASWRSGSV